MKNSKFASNYLYKMRYEVFVITVALRTAPYVSRVLGVTAIGDYGFTAGIVSYFGIAASVGAVNYAKREIPFC